MKISIEIIWTTKKKIIAAVAVLLLMVILGRTYITHKLDSVQSNDLPGNMYVPAQYPVSHSQPYEQYPEETQPQPTVPETIPIPRPTPPTEAVNAPQTIYPQSQYYPRSIDNTQRPTPMPAVQDQPLSVPEKKSILPEGLAIIESKWVVSTRGSDAYQYSLIVTLKNISQITFKQVRVEFSILTTGENKKYAGSGKSVSNLAPGDVWDFDACGYTFSNNIDFYKTYYSRIDKITAVPDRR